MKWRTRIQSKLRALPKSGCYGLVMSQYDTPQNTRAYIAADLRINHFLLREDAVARDDQCVKALEEALAERENALREEPITRW